MFIWILSLLSADLDWYNVDFGVYVFEFIDYHFIHDFYIMVLVETKQTWYYEVLEFLENSIIILIYLTKPSPSTTNIEGHVKSVYKQSSIYRIFVTFKYFYVSIIIKMIRNDKKFALESKCVSKISHFIFYPQFLQTSFYLKTN